MHPRTSWCLPSGASRWLDTVVAESPSSMEDKVFAHRFRGGQLSQQQCVQNHQKHGIISGPGQAMPVFSVDITKKEESLFGEKWSKVVRLLQAPTAISGRLEWLGLGLTGSWGGK